MTEDVLDVQLIWNGERLEWIVQPIYSADFLSIFGK